MRRLILALRLYRNFNFTARRAWRVAGGSDMRYINLMNRGIE